MTLAILQSAWYTWGIMTKFAKGRRALFICDRSGFTYPWRQAVKEPGTGLMVHRSESDGKFNIVDHPQNFPPTDLSERIALKWSRPDRDEVAADTTFIQTEDGQDLIWENVDMIGDSPIYAQVSADIAGT